MAQTTTLEEQIAALVRQHGLASLSIHAYARSDGTVWFGSNAQAETPAGRLCGTDTVGAKDASIELTVSTAIDALNAKRNVKADVPELAPMEQAA